MDELEKMSPLCNNDVEAFERFTDLARVTVVKLKAENRQAELGEGTLHRQLGKKLSDRQLESYSRWLSVQSKEQSVTSLCEWMKEEVTIKVEAAEMARGLEQKQNGDSRGDGRKSRSYLTGKDGKQNYQNQRYPSVFSGNMKPPCMFCGHAGHGIWNCRSFQHAIIRGGTMEDCKRKAVVFSLPFC